MRSFVQVVRFGRAAPLSLGGSSSQVERGCDRRTIPAVRRHRVGPCWSKRAVWLSSRWSGALRIVRRLGLARPGVGIAHIWRALRSATDYDFCIRAEEKLAFGLAPVARLVLHDSELGVVRGFRNPCA
jgi:hypothetical protein